MSASQPTVSVLVASCGRPERLRACLEGLHAQTRPANEVVVVTRLGDGGTSGAVADQSHEDPQARLRTVIVDRPGLVAALNAGLATARGEIVAFVDDDAVPAEDWLARIVSTFRQDHRIAAVGGRDVIVRDGRWTETPPRRKARRSPRVGRIGWCGRMAGNHHVGQGTARDVDVLKGANMSFRRELIVPDGFDRRLRGRRTEDHSELSVCLPLRARGMRVVYDPEIIVWHSPAPRTEGDERARQDREAVLDASHNEALAIFDYFDHVRGLVFLAWGTVCGTTHAPGLAIAARELVVGKPGATTRWRAAQAGRIAAWRTHRTVPRSPAIETTRPTRRHGSGGQAG